jgi:superoxide dismutase, Fe-Mn family
MPTTAITAAPSYEVQQRLKPKKLEGLSEKMMDQHWKLYEGYVTNTNFLNKAIWEAVDAGTDLNKPSIAELQRRLGFEYNGMVLHEYYFGALCTGTKEPSASTDLGEKITEDFGSFDRWKKQFSDIGKMRGIGWVMTSLDPMTKRLNTFWVSDHEIGQIAGFIPVIVMDMWEHAFVTDYGATAAGRAEYLQAYFKNLDWETSGQRLAYALQGKMSSRAKK